jgi:hypothetical protein
MHQFLMKTDASLLIRRRLAAYFHPKFSFSSPSWRFFTQFQIPD